MKFIFTVLLAGVSFIRIYAAGNFEIDPQNAVIELPAAANDSVKVAAEELQEHLKLITGKTIPVNQGNQADANKYIFKIGIRYPGDNRELAPEEARWRITPECAYFYGDDSKSRNGTLFSVYEFLEKVLQVRWIEPGDIEYAVQETLSLAPASGEWRPEFRGRTIRASYAKQPPQVKDLKLKDFQLSQARFDELMQQVKRWRLRMRMGYHDLPLYGHAFTNWWKLYGQDHSEYFALNSSGKRAPVDASCVEDHPRTEVLNISRIKLCVSNPAVHQQIVDNWLSNKSSNNYLNVCLNDSAPDGFCRCENCRALDNPDRPTAGWYSYYTDRYVWFANQVAHEAGKHNPSARPVMYAYRDTEYPPSRFEVDKNVTVAIVPTNFDLPGITSLLKGWTEKGATEIIFRPNMHHYYFVSTIPLGFEKHVYDLFQTARANNCIVFDFDALLNTWLVTGMADYVLAKAMYEPSKPFEYWEKQYLGTFGPAENDIRQYYTYWRTAVWDQRIAPDHAEIIKKGRYGFFTRGLMWNLGQYYRESDFDQTDSFLSDALKHNLSARETARVERLQIANRHARLVFNVVTATPAEKKKHLPELLNFRKQHKDMDNVLWHNVFESEKPWIRW